MPPHRRALFSSLPYHATFNPYVQVSVSSPRMDEAAGHDGFDGMAKGMREAFATTDQGLDPGSFTFTASGATTSEGANSSAAEETFFSSAFPPGFFANGPAPKQGPPRSGGSPPPPSSGPFNEARRPYDFNWSNTSASGAAHPGSVPYSPAGGTGPHPNNHGQGGSRGRYSPYTSAGPPPHHFHRRPPQPPPPHHYAPRPPFTFNSSSEGPWAYRGPWINGFPFAPPPPPGANPDYDRARREYEESVRRWMAEKMEQIRKRMEEANNRRNADARARGEYASGARGRPSPDSGRDGHQHHSNCGNGGYYQSDAQSRAYPSGSTNAGPKGPPPLRSAPPPRTKPANAPQAPRASVFRADIAQAWEIYSAQWKKLTSPSLHTTNATIKLSEIPWPLIVDTSKMRSLSEMNDKVTSTSVGEFILSPKHSAGVANKKRIHQALKLYHPDRFEIVVVAKVEEGQKKAVRELGEVVAKCLNKLLERRIRRHLVEAHSRNSVN
ncbi:hypothetical protein FRB90_007401 [Tulasnella sp. 427]|nr:hypothetical protein FRB90_007401 [Tulasnella sp. 427]